MATRWLETFTPSVPEPGALTGVLFAVRSLAYTPSLPAFLEKNRSNAAQKWPLPDWSFACARNSVCASGVGICLSAPVAGIVGEIPIRYSAPDPPAQAADSTPDFDSLVSP